MARKDSVLYFCIMFTIVTVLISNVTSAKLFDFTLFGTTIILPAGTPIFCLAFVATDVISEIWGRKHALYVSFLAVIARLTAIGYIMATIAIPGAEHWTGQDAYNQILGSSMRVLIAGVFAYTVASVIDAYVFHFFREKHKNANLLFFRNTASTFTAQFFGGITFVTIAFYGVMPTEKLPFVLAANIGLKWLMALIDTPLVYLIRNLALEKPLLNLKG